MAYNNSTFGGGGAVPVPPVPETGGVSSQTMGEPRCNCASVKYKPSHPCYDQCGQTGGDETGGSGGGSCPDGTPPGYAACCPPGPKGQRVWRPDTKTCEYEDDRHNRGEDTCRGELPKCPPGQAVWCDFTDANFKCAPDGSAGGNAGGGGGGGGGGGAKGSYAAPPDPALEQSATVWQQILQRLQAPSRYTPQVMQSLAGETKMGSEQQANRLTEQSNADLAQRGLLRSGPAAAAQRGIRADVSATNLQGWNQILRAKVDADYQDKTQAIKEGMDWVNSLRDYIARSAATQAQKDAAMANVQLGYARLTQEMSQLRESYAQQINLILLRCQMNPSSCA